MPKPKVFISYSREDEVWKKRLEKHLHVLQRRGAAEFWDTSELEPGADWSKEIESAAQRSDVAVLLVSPSFLASDFIVNNELPILFERHRKEGLALVPVLVRPSMWSAIPGIAELQFANDLSRPLSSASEAERDTAYASIAQRISDLVEAVALRLDSPRGL